MIQVVDFEARVSPHREKATIVGCFRSHPYGFVPADDENDFGISRYLTDALGVPLILLIQLDQESAPMASLFFKAAGADDGKSSELFPFDSKALAREDRGPTEAVSEETAREVPVPRPALQGRRTRNRQLAAVAMGALSAVLVFGVMYSRKHTGVQPAGSTTGKATAAPAASLKAPESSPVPESATGHADGKPTREPPAATAVPPRRPEAAPSSSRSAGAEISFQPLPRSRFRRAMRGIPLVSKSGHGVYEDGFVPARPVTQPPLTVPAAISRGLSQPVDVDLRIRIAKSGRVTQGQVLPPGRKTEFDTLARNAASRWVFQPARMNDKAVASEMLVHFRFRPGR
ncbi:MAG: energy transducer TonB [Acidobacteriota bacterium]|nr:energy transducer TonB [Acidobacteriota bacterium]